MCRMKQRIWRLGLSSVSVATAAVCGYLMLPDGKGPTPARAETNAVTFPPLEQLEHYTTVRRGVTREHMLTSRAALDAIKAGQPVPTGTHVVLVDYQSDVLHRYLVAQKTGEASTSGNTSGSGQTARSRLMRTRRIAIPAISARARTGSSCSPSATRSASNDGA